MVSVHAVGSGDNTRTTGCTLPGFEKAVMGGFSVLNMILFSEIIFLIILVIQLSFHMGVYS